MSDQNKTVLSPKTDTRKTEVNKGILLFNRMGIWVITIALLILGTIIAAANSRIVFFMSCVPFRLVHHNSEFRFFHDVT